MFFQKDYILRMIEMMGDFMRRIGEILDDMQRGRLLDEACRQHCGMDLQAARGLSLESLAELLAPKPRLMLSEILYIQAMQTSLPPEEREQLFYRCGGLLLSLKEESLLSELRHQRLGECLREAGGLFTPGERMDAAAFFFQAEQFEQGEDQLFAALDAAPRGEYPSLLGRGEALLSACLTVPGERLRAGGLPLEEVREGLAALKGRREALALGEGGRRA